MKIAHAPSHELLFPWSLKLEEGTKEAIKWRHATTSYEVYITALEGDESTHVQTMIPHCLRLRNKVLNAVGIINHQGPSLFQTFPRSLEEELQNTWNQVILDNPPAGNTVADFDIALRLFIATSASPEQQHELLLQLRYPKKPHNMQVQSFWYSLRRLNGYVSWFPGTEAPLSEAVIKQALFDAMPPKWQEKFEQMGKHFHTLAVPEVVQYFRTLEKAAQRAMQENNLKQRREGIGNGNGKRRSTPAVTPKSNKRQYDSKNEDVADDAPCPRHPKGTHTNGECRQHPKNNKQFSPSNKRPRHNGGNGNTDGHVAEFKDLNINDDEHYDSDTTVGFIAQHDLARHDEAMLAGTLNEPCEGTFTCDSYVHIDCQVNEVLSSSHHTANLHAYPIQESEQQNDFSIDSMLNDYALVCEEAYLSGSSNINLKPNVHPTQTALRLRSVGLMRVNKIHNSPSGKVLKVLFDTGSDKTLINRSALPKQAIPAKDKNPPNITGLHDTKPLDRVLSNY